MKSCVISNGTIYDISYIKKEIIDCDLIICADGGTNNAYKMNITPNLIIGDLDSVNKDILCYYKEKGVNIERYPTIKDMTDTQIATKKALELGASEIVFIAVIGSRFDHTYANLSLLLFLLKRNIKGVIINEKNEIYLINDSIELTGKIGDILSLIPYSSNVNGIYTEGLQYALSGNNMSLELPYGVSNVFIKNTVRIKIQSGLLLVIKSRD